MSNVLLVLVIVVAVCGSVWAIAPGLGAPGDGDEERWRAPMPSWAVGRFEPGLIDEDVAGRSTAVDAVFDRARIEKALSELERSPGLGAPGDGDEERW